MTGHGVAAEKSPALILVTLCTWALLAWSTWGVFETALADAYGLAISSLLASLHVAWMLFWLWAIHNFWHQAASAFLPHPRPKLTTAWVGEPVAVLYMTCDDFDPLACEACLAQSHPNTRLIICDDSQSEAARRAIDAWVAQRGSEVTVSRRGNRVGYKAGNLNHAIAQHVREAFIVICDADEILPRDFVASLLGYFAAPSIAFVQARHEARSDGATRFSTVLGPTIKIFHDYCLPMRNRFGFVACYGHGVMLRRSAWEAIGGFPEVTSEDLAFASRALTHGLRGVYAEAVVAQEAFPPNYRAFIAKYRKIAGGTVEYFQREYPRLLFSRQASLVEKLDIALTFSFCVGGLVTLVSVIGALALSLLSDNPGRGQLAAWVFLVWLVGPLTPIFALAKGRFPTPGSALRYLVTTTVAFVSLAPILAARVIAQLFDRRSTAFEVTGVAATQRDPVLRYAAIAGSGLCTLVAAVTLRSPAFAPLLSFSMMLVLGPLMALSERRDALGFVGRNCVFLPFLALAGSLAWPP